VSICLARHSPHCLKTVCLIVKAPRLGEVKTRLAQGIGTEHAAAIYRTLVEHQIGEIPSGWEIVVYFAPATAQREMEHWLKPYLGNGVRFLPQVDGDLGQRLAKVVDTEFARGSDRIFLIGGDCPGLSRDYFGQADTALDFNDVVIGPAHDGGYVLLGLKRSTERLEASLALFTGIAWSSPAVLEQTLSAASKNRLSVHLLHPLADIDDVTSLKDQSELIQNILKGT
jgi:rSAM/selenodomain-associated transferase 1